MATPEYYHDEVLIPGEKSIQTLITLHPSNKFDFFFSNLQMMCEDSFYTTYNFAGTFSAGPSAGQIVLKIESGTETRFATCGDIIEPDTPKPKPQNSNYEI